MSKHVTDFAASWVFENLNAGPYDPGQDIIDMHVNQLIRDAKSEGISEAALTESLGDLSDFVSQGLEEATDNEVQRLVEKDD